MPDKIQALEHRQPATLLIMTSLARYRILMAICVVAIIATLLLPRIAQDAQLYNWLVFVSGHSLKHIAAGIGCLVFLRHLRLCRRLHQ